MIDRQMLILWKRFVSQEITIYLTHVTRCGSGKIVINFCRHDDSIRASTAKAIYLRREAERQYWYRNLFPHISSRDCDLLSAAGKWGRLHSYWVLSLFIYLLFHKNTLRPLKSTQGVFGINIGINFARIWKGIDKIRNRHVPTNRHTTYDCFLVINYV